MPIRFSTEAANADVWGDVADGMPKAVGADGRPRNRADRGDRAPAGQNKSSDASGSQAKASEAKPGKDINAAGFIKDKDAGKP